MGKQTEQTSHAEQYKEYKDKYSIHFPLLCGLGWQDQLVNMKNDLYTVLFGVINSPNFFKNENLGEKSAVIGIYLTL